MDHDALRRHRRTRGLTQAQLARLAGVSPGYVARLERGEAERVSPLLERRLSRALAVAREEIAPVDERRREIRALDNGTAQPRRREPRPLPRFGPNRGGSNA